MASRVAPERRPTGPIGTARSTIVQGSLHAVDAYRTVVAEGSPRSPVDPGLIPTNGFSVASRDRDTGVTGGALKISRVQTALRPYLLTIQVTRDWQEREALSFAQSVWTSGVLQESARCTEAKTRKPKQIHKATGVVHSEGIDVQ
ncbi:hypothetical protein R1flu_026495 [Riccia fluitans]|uniref:Uncharacterized protein n=1 Tax=Riccia fluitans TaxID=41844 RepID=A0ABD1XG48_9MARC